MSDFSRCQLLPFLLLWYYRLLSISFRLYLKNWRYFGVKTFGTGRDITGLYEQNRVLRINTKVLFYT